jgi:hypothetical protein
MASSLERRLDALEAQCTAAIDDGVALVVYRDADERDSLLARATASRVVLCIPHNGRDMQPTNENRHAKH